MHHRHMQRRHPGPFHFIFRLMIVFLILGALFSIGSRGRQSAYWDGFRDGALTAQSAAPAAPDPGAGVPAIPPAAPHGFNGPSSAGGPGWGLLFLIPLCGLMLFGFIGFLFAISRGARRARRNWGEGGPPGKGRARANGKPWPEGDTTAGRQVDEDEIGPEKDPTDYL